MRLSIVAAAGAALLAGCSGEAPAPAEEEAPETLQPGQYALSWSAVEIRSTDGGEPATSAANAEVEGEGDTEAGGEGEGEPTAGFASAACVGEDGTIDPSAFAELGDTCTPTSSYARGGRIAMQMECRREGASGQVMQSVNGSTTADGFEAEVSTTTYLSGQGDYEMTRTVTGRRVGECPPAGAAEAEGTDGVAAETPGAAG